MLSLKAMAAQISLGASLIGSKTGKIKKIPIDENFTFSTQRKSNLVAV